MRWIELFLTVVREGIGSPISLEFLLPHKGKERADILAEVDKVALYHYKLKVLYEDKIRRRFGRSQGQQDADAEDEATKALVDSVVGELSFGELAQGDAIDVAAEETDEDEDYSSSEYDSSDEDGSDDSGTEEGVESPSPGASETRATPPDVSYGKSSSSGLPPRNNSRPPESRRPISPPPVPLKASRSMSAINRPTRRSADIPPVPSIPGPLRRSEDSPVSRTPHTPLRTAISKPLPPSPAPHAARGSGSSSPKNDSKRKKSGSLQPPELNLISQLLPVFTEMVSSSRRVLHEVIDMFRLDTTTSTAEAKDSIDFSMMFLVYTLNVIVDFVVMPICINAML